MPRPTDKVSVTLTVNKEDGTEQQLELKLWSGAIGNLHEHLPLGKDWTSAVLTFTNSRELQAWGKYFGVKAGKEEGA